MAKALQNYLMAKGFAPGEDNMLKQTLFGDYSIEFMPDELEWEDSYSVSIYISAKSFSDVMFAVFDKAQTSLAWQYQPRKLRQDTTGCLMMASVDWEAKTPTENSVLRSGDMVWDLRDIEELQESLQSPVDVFDVMYKKRLGYFLIAIEDVWVYLFLCKQTGMDSASIFNALSETFMSDHVRQWNLLKPMDAQMIKEFSNRYDEVMK